MSFSVRVFLLSLAVALSASPSLAQQEQPAEEKELTKEQIAAGQRQINTELSSLAQELAKNLSHPGFRGRLRAAIAQSKNREHILELENFLGKSVGRPDAPPGLKKLQESARRAKRRLKTSGVWNMEGLDLYLPVVEHRKKWKGGAEILVAFSPVNNEQDIKEIVAYSVKTGKRVVLDPKKAPQTPVVVIAPEEHEFHEVKAAPETKESRPPDDRKPDVEGSDPPEPKEEKQPGNSKVGVKWLKIYNDREPWWKGSPEVYTFFGIRKGNDCRYDYYDYDWLHWVNKTRTWYYTWGYTSWYFDSTYYNRMRLYIYERDGGGYNNPLLYQIYSGITCAWRYRYSGDDYIDHATQYLSLLAWNRDKYQFLGDAYVVWHKTH